MRKLHYYNISLKVTIAGKYAFDAVESIHIENSTDKISDTAKVTLPRKFMRKVSSKDRTDIGKERLLDLIKVGDTIKIEFGYNGDLQTEFEGYITRIGAEIPVELECEDEMWKLKKMPPVNKLFRNANIKEFVQFLAPGYEVDCKYTATVGKFAIENLTPYMALLEMKSKGFRFSFINGKIKVLMNIDPDVQKRHQFNLNRNVRKGSDLKYETKDDRKFWVKAVSKEVGTGKEVSYEFGEKGENEKTFTFLGLKKDELKIHAENEHAKLSYDGYGGGFESWCYPRTKAGDSAELTDPNYPDKHRDGIYYINEVITDINASDGIKRKNKITFKIK